MGVPADLAITEVAALRGGRWAAVQAALAMLYARGALDGGHAGGISRKGPRPAGAEPLELALYLVLFGSVGPRELAGHRRVRRALVDIQRRLVDRGLVRPPYRRIVVPTVLLIVPTMVLGRILALGMIQPIVGVWAVVVLVGVAAWFVPRRTVRGARLLRQIRAGQPMPNIDTDDQAHALRPEAAGLGMAVAVHGSTALLATIPRFAREHGLLDGGRAAPYHGDGQLAYHYRGGGGLDG